ncbi:cytochrome P450 [Streptomyces sp. NPDC048277]|uniref:cytochrome P450 family protein n=1 Tax=Streptomyces sp. NPDC048277 TaxID=3155027 RepID=UPI0033DB32F5
MNPARETIRLDTEFLHEPNTRLDRLGVSAPVARAVLPDGSPGWFVTGYAEAKALLADPRLRHNSPVPRQDEAGDGGPKLPEGLVSSMITMDPPQHTRLRKLVNKAFTTRTVAALRPRIRQVADELLDAIPVPGQVDLLTAFASPLPITVICELLGVPAEDRADFRRWSLSVTSAFSARTITDAHALLGYLADLVAHKRAHPTGDPLSDLVHVSDGDDQLTGAELTSMAALLLVAGHESTVNLIGNGMLALLKHPDQFEVLRRDPSLIPDAVEEFLRVASPAHITTTRFAAEAIRVGDVEIPAGESVMVSLLGANHDPERFAEPHRLDVTRAAAGHLAFGHGIHHCLGAPLARLEGEIAFRGLLGKFHSVELAEQPRWRDTMMMHGLESLLVQLS